MRALLRLLLCVALIAPLPRFAVQAAGPSTTASSAILLDGESGRVLYAQNADEKRPIASITKLMTALVAVESQPNLAQMVRILPEWTGAEGSSLYLRAGEELTFETLLYGLLLQSGNDAAVAIANHCAGDLPRFVEWMNLRARDLGMKNTQFQNPNGLNDEGHYSSASDMAKLARACLQNETVANIVSSKSYAAEGRSFTNHNKLLWQYPDCIGMKTGYTELAGRTLVSAARREGQSLVVVTLNDSNDWRDHKALFDYGFSAYPQKTPVLSGDELATIPVQGSLLHSVSVYAKQALRYPVAEGEPIELVLDLPETLRAPLRKGDIVGSVSLMVKDRAVGSSYLLLASDVSLDLAVGSNGLRDLFERLSGSKAAQQTHFPLPLF